MNAIPKNDIDYKIGYWIENVMYINIQNPKNIFNSSRIYLADPEFYIFDGTLRFKEIYFYDRKKQRRTLNDDIKNEPLLLFDSCFDGSDKYQMLFNYHFSVLSPEQIEKFMNDMSTYFKSENITEYPNVSIRCYSKDMGRIELLYNIIFSKNGGYTIQSVWNQGFSEDIRLLSATININRKDQRSQKIVLDANLTEVSKNFSLSGITFFDIAHKKIDNPGANMNVVEFNMQGRRQTMEDKSLYCQFGNTEYYMIAVLDGHGSARSAQYFSIDIPKRLNEYIKGGIYITEEIIKKVFIDSDRNAYYTKRFQKTNGTCFSGILLSKDTIFVINLGDSRTCVYKEDIDKRNPNKPLVIEKEVFCTIDHKPTNKKEIERFKKYDENVHGGRIKGLTVSRALGDYYLIKDSQEKDYKTIIHGENILNSGYHQVVSPIPDVKILKREENIHIIIHCDGVNEKLTEEQILQLYKERYLGTNNISKVLCDYAYKEGSTDNLSVICVRLL